MSQRTDRPRIIGSVKERIILHLITDEIIERLTSMHPELSIDIEALDHIRLGFLREPCSRYMGLCSYSSQKPGRYKTQYEERHGIHRILLARSLLHENIHEAMITIHHELLHAILGSIEGHGPIFQRHDARFDRDVAQNILHHSTYLTSLLSSLIRA